MDNDIEKRQTLLNYVYQEQQSSQTSSLIQSEITGTTMNAFSPDGTYRNLVKMNRWNINFWKLAKFLQRQELWYNYSQ